MSGLIDSLRAHLSDLPTPSDIFMSADEAGKLLGKQLPAGCYMIRIQGDFRLLYLVDQNERLLQVLESDYPDATEPPDNSQCSGTE